LSSIEYPIGSYSGGVAWWGGAIPWVMVTSRQLIFRGIYSADMSPRDNSDNNVFYKVINNLGTFAS
jgi:hypothetical protein